MKVSGTRLLGKGMVGAIEFGLTEVSTKVFGNMIKRAVTVDSYILMETTTLVCGGMT